MEILPGINGRCFIFTGSGSTSGRTNGCDSSPVERVSKHFVDHLALRKNFVFNKRDTGLRRQRLMRTSALRHILVFPLLAFHASAVAADAVPPQLLDGRLKIALVAQEPEIRTPTAVVVDRRGQIWALENNTHFREKNYDGPPADRLRVFGGFAPDGRATAVTTFFAGFRDGMGLAPGKDDEIVLITRSKLLRLRDTSRDGVADQEEVLVELETACDYPHNGLSGLTRGPRGDLFFSLGENFGHAYQLKSADGKVLKGGGEGGSQYRCRDDGTNLERIATGFWNTYNVAFDAAERLFAVDNDPGAGSNCRLLHIITGGDYGYRQRYGNLGHPFISWNGELPGTLPMVCNTGEGPAGLVAYEGDGLPQDYVGNLIGGSWADHVLQRFPLEPRGASFSAKAINFVEGGTDFRPSGLAIAPDGSLVVTDWVDGSYSVHGKGRIWRISQNETKPRNERDQIPVPITPGERDATALLNLAPHALLPFLKSNDPFLTSVALSTLSRKEHRDFLLAHRADEDPKVRVAVLLALRQLTEGRDASLVAQFLADEDPAVRRAALQWVGEEHLNLKDQLKSATRAPMSRATFEAYLATVQLLGGAKPNAEWRDQKTMAMIVSDRAQQPALRTLALRLLPADSPLLPTSRAIELLPDAAGDFGTELIHALAQRNDDEAQAELRRIVADQATPAVAKAEALAGLARSADAPQTHTLLIKAAEGDDIGLRGEALRSLRGTLSPAEAGRVKAAWGSQSAAAKGTRELMQQFMLATRTHDSPPAAELAEIAARPDTEGEWTQSFAMPGDPLAGRRAFFHVLGSGCFVCHQVDARGGKVGPDLSGISRNMPAAKIAEAIRFPSREIAPQFVQWSFTLKNGEEASGVNLFEDNKEAITLVNGQGERTNYRVADIKERHTSETSIMPDNLIDLMTEEEFRDIVAYLSTN